MELSLRDLKELLGSQPSDAGEPLALSCVGQVCIVRSTGSGVWLGTVDQTTATAAGLIVRLSDARRIWRWKGAAELSELSRLGPSDVTETKMPSPVEVVEVIDVHEIIPITREAGRQFARVAPWSQR